MSTRSGNGIDGAVQRTHMTAETSPILAGQGQFLSIHPSIHPAWAWLGSSKTFQKTNTRSASKANCNGPSMRKMK